MRKASIPSSRSYDIRLYSRWGFAIVLFVNICVFPVSAEKELRTMLVTSLQHVGTFAHLLAKSYTLTITEEEKVVGDRLAQSIRVSRRLIIVYSVEANETVHRRISDFCLKYVDAILLRHDTSA
jgi:hypothetical protein